MLTCPLCAHPEPLAWRFGLQRCPACTLVFSPLAVNPGANEAMEDVYFGEEPATKGSSWVSLFERHNNSDTLARIARARPPGHRLLEVGVGSGSLLAAARAEGFDVLGCDLSAAVCRRVASCLGLPMHQGPLTDLPTATFDVVVLNHVLEHVGDPVEFLQAACNRLRPGGVAHIRVPNVACPEARLRGWTSYEPYHLLYFTPRTLKDAVERSALHIERLTTRESFSGWFLALARTGLGHNRHDEAVTVPQPAAEAPPAARAPWLEHTYRLASVGLGAATWPLRRLQAAAGYGDEVVCVARRPKEA